MATRRSFLSGLGALGWLAAGGAAAWFLRDQVFWPAPDASDVSGPESSGWLPFAARRQPLAIVSVNLNGAPVTALVDSGAQYSVVDRAYAERRGLPAAFGPPLVAYGVGGDPQVGRAVTVDLGLGALSVAGVKAAVLELGPITRASGLSIPLILGQDVLGALTLDIDFPRRRVAFRRPESVRPPEGAVAAEARREGRALHAAVTLEGAPLDLLVDTGASGALSLTTATAEKLGLTARPGRLDTSIVLGGVAQARVVAAERLVVAGAEIAAVDVYIFPGPPVPGFPAGLLGVGAFRGARALLDLGSGRLHLVRT